MRRKIELLACLLIVFVVVSRAQQVDKEGKAWLARFSEPALVNVDGMWESNDWGLYRLTQEEKSRDVTGEGEWIVHGVVSGKKVYLLFTWEGNVEYSAELEVQADDRLVGSYSRGLMQKGKRVRPVVFKKQ